MTEHYTDKKLYKSGYGLKTLGKPLHYEHINSTSLVGSLTKGNSDQSTTIIPQYLQIAFANSQVFFYAIYCFVNPLS